MYTKENVICDKHRFLELIARGQMYDYEYLYGMMEVLDLDDCFSGQDDFIQDFVEAYKTFLQKCMEQ